MAQKRPRGRPKVEHPRVNTGWCYSQATIDTVNTLLQRYQQEAPSYLDLSGRLLLEALVEYADRENLSFSEIFGVPAVASPAE